MATIKTKRCDLCKNRMKAKDPQGTLVLPLPATASQQRPQEMDAYVEGRFMRFFGGPPSIEQVQLDICMGCCYGLVRASSLSVGVKRRLLAQVTDRHPVAAGKDVE